MPESEHRDTSCPVTPIERYQKPRRHRWPDAIGIGFPKCGTGAMGFIDCHSKLVFREAEPYFWNSWIRVSNIMKNEMKDFFTLLTSILTFYSSIPRLRL